MPTVPIAIVFFVGLFFCDRNTKKYRKFWPIAFFIALLLSFSFCVSVMETSLYSQRSHGGMSHPHTKGRCNKSPIKRPLNDLSICEKRKKATQRATLAARTIKTCLVSLCVRRFCVTNPSLRSIRNATAYAEKYGFSGGAGSAGISTFCQERTSASA